MSHPAVVVRKERLQLPACATWCAVNAAGGTAVSRGRSQAYATSTAQLSMPEAQLMSGTRSSERSGERHGFAADYAFAFDS